MKHALIKRMALGALAFGSIVAAHANVFVPTGNLNSARTRHTASLMANGQVLVVGGESGGTALASVEIYNPATGDWTAGAALSQARSHHTATPLLNGRVLVAGGLDEDPLNSAAVFDPVAGTWSPVGSMSFARSGHSATLLADGRVLVAGGKGTLGPVERAEVFNPATGTWTQVGVLIAARSQHAAVSLADGRVMVTGGLDGADELVPTCEIYNPATSLWTSAAPLGTPRHSHTATLLLNGQVLVAGGVGESAAIGLAELFDAAAGTWTDTGAMPSGRFNHTATLLGNGRVLAVAGQAGSILDTAQLYDPQTGTWNGIATLGGAVRTAHAATLLADGRVLLSGGEGAGASALNVATIFDPTLGSWAASTALPGPRARHTGTLLADGRVLVAGGVGSGSTVLASSLTRDPVSGAWNSAGTMISGRRGHTATLLLSGRVLVAGGFDVNGSPELRSERFDPVLNTWTQGASLNGGREEHTATLLDDGRVLVVGGRIVSGPINSVEIYNPATDTWTVGNPLPVSRASHSAVRLANGKVLVVGGQTTGGTTLGTALLYDPVLGTWTPTGSLATARRQATATLMPTGDVIVVGGRGAAFVASAERFNPVTQTWSPAGALNTARSGHVAVLLTNGQLAVAGGEGGAGSLKSVERYDAAEGANGNWRLTGFTTDDRREHTVTLLANGGLLAVGGQDDGNILDAVEVFTFGAGADVSRKPAITSALVDGLRKVILRGQGLISGFAGSGGNGSQDSPSNLPVVTIRLLSNDQTIVLTPDSTRPISATGYVSNPIPLFRGFAMLTAFVDGVASDGRIVVFRPPPQFRVGDVAAVDLSFVDLAQGETMRVTGLPPGLVFTAQPVPSISGTVLGMGSASGVQIQILSGTRVVRVIPFDLAVEPYPFIGSFEVLLEQGVKPVGKLRVTVTPPSVKVQQPAYSAVLERAGEPVRTARGTFNSGNSPLSVTLSFPAVGTLTEATYALVLRDDSDLVTGATVPGGLVTARGFRLVRPGRIPGGNPAVTMVFPPLTAGDRVTTPAGTGFARGTANAAAMIPLVGQLGDAQPFTTSLSHSQTNQAVLWVTPYKNKQSYVGGIVNIGDLGVPGRGGSTESAVSGLRWERVADATATSYPLGFGPLSLTSATSRWIPTPTAEGLARSLGLNFRRMTVGFDAPTTDNLPQQLSLRDSFGLIRIAPTDGVPFTGRSVGTNGTFSGTMTLAAPAAGTTYSGVFLQAESFGTLIGRGVVRVPITAPVKGSFQTMGMELQQ